MFDYGLSFVRPRWLALLLLVVPVVYLARTSEAALGGWRRWASLTSRVVLVVALVFALAGVELTRLSDELVVMFLLDGSASIDQATRQAALENIRSAVAGLPAQHRAGLVVFAEQAAIEVPPEVRPRISGVESVVNTELTNLARALRLALAAFPEGTEKRIVVLSDGEENLESALAEAGVARAADVLIDVLPLTRVIQAEALIDKLILPSEVHEDEPFDLTVVLHSWQPGPATLRLFRDGHYLGDLQTRLRGGTDVLRIPQRLTEPGFYTYEVVLAAQADEEMRNNRAIAFTQIKGTPRVLYAEGKSDQTHYLASALTTSGLTVDTTKAGAFPATLAELQHYDAILLSDIAATHLSDLQLAQLKTYVEDLAGGLAMVGGEDSFGLGGYYKTPVEEALPVSMDARKKRQLPSLALVLCIDKSGSMTETTATGEEKVELAKASAVLTLELLAPWDKLGVVAFDTSPRWAVPLTDASETDAIIAKVGTIRAGGGTSIYPALAETERQLARTEAMLKHVILLSDGMSAPGDFETLVKKMAQEGITLTAVAIGADADQEFMYQLARLGGGQYYYTEDLSVIPRIFTKDTLIASKSLLIEEPFQPQLQTPSQLVRGIDWGEAPPLLGYVNTRAKPRAQVVLATHRGDPLLATWRFGLGKSLAFTSDCKARWAQQWLRWPGYEALWAQAVRWLGRQRGGAAVQTTVSVEGAEGRITVDAVDEGGNFLNFLQLVARLVDPDLRGSSVPLRQTGPGRYQARFPASRQGHYFVTLSDAGGTLLDTAGVCVNYPAEFRRLTPNLALLGQLVERTGGEMRTSLDGVFRATGRAARRLRSIWPELLTAALLLLVADVAIRRFVLVPELLPAWVRQPRWAFARRRASARRRVEVVPVLARLQARRAQVRAVEFEPARTAEEEETTEVLERISAMVTTPEGAGASEEEALSEEIEYTARLLAAKRRAQRQRMDQ